METNEVVVYRFRPGDVVTVRNDLELSGRYCMDGHKKMDSFVHGMDNFRGKKVTIEAIIAGKYRIAEHGCNWVDEMFEEYFSDPDKWLREAELPAVDDLFV